MFHSSERTQILVNMLFAHANHKYFPFSRYSSSRCADRAEPNNNFTRAHTAATIHTYISFRVQKKFGGKSFDSNEMDHSFRSVCERPRGDSLVQSHRAHTMRSLVKSSFHVTPPKSRAFDGYRSRTAVLVIPNRVRGFRNRPRER